MSNFNQFHSNEEELTSSSSDEKMDTGSESFRSQDTGSDPFRSQETPNSIRSSDFEDHQENIEQSVLRLQNPEEINDILTSNRSDDFISKRGDDFISNRSDAFTTENCDNLSERNVEDSERFLRSERNNDSKSKTDDIISKSSDDDEHFLKIENSNNFGNLRTPDMFKNFQKDSEFKDPHTFEESANTSQSTSNVLKTMEEKNGDSTNRTDASKSSIHVNQEHIRVCTKSSDIRTHESTKTDVTKSPRISALDSLKTEDLSDSFLNKMSLEIDSPKDIKSTKTDVTKSLRKSALDSLKTEDLSDSFLNKMSLEIDSPKDIKSTKTDVTKSPKKSALDCLNTEDLSDSFLNKMSSIKIDPPKDIRPKNLGLSPPKFSSTLTLTTNHPLMGLGSPDDFPDVIPKKHKEEDRDLSLSSIEDERPSETNGLYSPQTNTSKNNLYFTENFVTAESQILSDTLELPPDVVGTRVGRRKIVSKFDLTPQRYLGSNLDGNEGESGVKLSCHSTPKFSQPVDITTEEFHSGVAEWCESASQLRAMPNFDLPIEMSSTIGIHNDLDSPDLISSSTQEERSAYEAKLDPYTGSVALRQTAPKEHHKQRRKITSMISQSGQADLDSPDLISSSTQEERSAYEAKLDLYTGSVALKQTTPKEHHNQRRKIMLPPEEEDRCSLDSLSAPSMESEEEPPTPMPQPQQSVTVSKHDEEADNISDDDTKRSKSTNTVSYSSEPIPEYSLCEELSNERGWVSVHSQACDVKVIEPYKRVLSHGGYSAHGAALIVFSACHLPDNARPDYTYVMDNLFLYVLWSLERLVTDEYVLVYLHGSAGRRRLPAFHWLHECYKLIDRRLRKSLKQLYLVHPTFWLKSFVLITKPFVSSKFFKKLSYVKSLDELMEKVPVDPNAIPDVVKQYDANRRR